MNQIIKGFLLIVFMGFFFKPSFTQAAESNGFNAFLAAGPNFVFPTSVRVGWNQWEFGMLTRNFVGLNKVFSTSGSSVYSSFALGINTDSYQKGLGFQGAIGFNYDLFWNLSFRGEMLANANTNGSSMCHALLGVSYGF